MMRLDSLHQTKKNCLFTHQQQDTDGKIPSSPPSYGQDPEFQGFIGCVPMNNSQNGKGHFSPLSPVPSNHPSNFTLSHRPAHPGIASLNAMIETECRMNNLFPSETADFFATFYSNASEEDVARIERHLERGWRYEAMQWVEDIVMKGDLAQGSRNILWTTDGIAMRRGAGKRATKAELPGQ